LHDRTFTGAIGSGSLTAFETPIGSDIDNAAGSLQQKWQCGPAQEKRRIQIYGHGLTPLFITRVRRIRAHNDAGAVHQAINVSEFINGIDDKFFAIIGFTEITCPRCNAVRYIGDLFQSTFVASMPELAPVTIATLMIFPKDSYRVIQCIP
jgi:hypothetical protein